MWLICQTAFRKGKTKLLVRGVNGAEWVFCPIVKGIKNDKVSLQGCRRCSQFIRFEQTCIPQTRTRKVSLMPKRTSSFHVVKPPLNKWKVKPASTALLSPPPVSLMREKQPIIDVFEEQDYLLILAELPGMDEKDVNVKADENTITIEAANATEKFLKTIKLPACITGSVVDFKYRNNILEARWKRIDFAKS